MKVFFSKLKLDVLLFSNGYCFSDDTVIGHLENQNSKTEITITQIQKELPIASFPTFLCSWLTSNSPFSSISRAINLTFITQSLITRVTSQEFMVAIKRDKNTNHPSCNPAQSQDQRYYVQVRN